MVLLLEHLFYNCIMYVLFGDEKKSIYYLMTSFTMIYYFETDACCKGLIIIVIHSYDNKLFNGIFCA